MSSVRRPLHLLAISITWPIQVFAFQVSSLIITLVFCRRHSVSEFVSHQTDRDLAGSFQPRARRPPGLLTPNADFRGTARRPYGEQWPRAVLQRDL